MKSFFTFLVLFAKIYLGIRVLFWAILKLYAPEQHSLSEIEGYLVFLVLDIWITQSNGGFNIKKD
jgi:hypothetical protein